MGRAAIALIEFLLGVEPLARDAVETLVGPRVDVAGCLHSRPDLTHYPLVPLFGSADEVVVGDVEVGPGFTESLDNTIGKLDRRHVSCLGCLFDLLAVLIGTGQEVRLFTARAMKTRERIGGDGGVGMADMGHVVDVVDRGGDVETHGLLFALGGRCCCEGNIGLTWSAS